MSRCSGRARKWCTINATAFDISPHGDAESSESSAIGFIRGSRHFSHPKSTRKPTFEFCYRLTTHLHTKSCSAIDWKGRPASRDVDPILLHIFPCPHQLQLHNTLRLTTIGYTGKRNGSFRAGWWWTWGREEIFQDIELSIVERRPGYDHTTAFHRLESWHNRRIRRSQNVPSSSQCNSTSGGVPASTEVVVGTFSGRRRAKGLP